jgi:hypothetical protein
VHRKLSWVLLLLKNNYLHKAHRTILKEILIENKSINEISIQIPESAKEAIFNTGNKSFNERTNRNTGNNEMRNELTQIKKKLEAHEVNTENRKRLSPEIRKLLNVSIT